MPPSRVRSLADLALGVALCLVAAAATLLEPGAVRTSLTLPILLCLPGYLLLQACIVPAAPAGTRLLHALYGIGISPALVGLAALATSLFEGGFQVGTIVAMVTIVSLGFGAAAGFRRLRLQPVTATHAETAQA